MTTVRIHHCVADTPHLDGVVVIIDVFRASNTVIGLLEAGAPEVLLARGLDEARDLKRAWPGHVLLGERNGLMPDGFDGNNSPALAPFLAASGRSAILTTSAGTQAVGKVGAAHTVVFASFANAGTVVRFIEALRVERVELLAAGLGGEEPAREDDLCAEVLAAGLGGQSVHRSDLRSELLGTPGADRLRRLGQHDDLELCLALDRSTMVPRLEPGTPPRAVRG